MAHSQAHADVSPEGPMTATTSRSERDGADADEPNDGLGTLGTSLVPFEDVARPEGVDPHEWASLALTSPAEVCAIRFATHEADLESPDLTGLGRLSAVRFPRLGGVLRGRIPPAGVGAELLRVGVEQTVRAGYHAALATHQVADVPVEHADAASLWDAFVPVSYRIPRSVAATAWSVCRFDALWVALLEHLGLDDDANRIAKGLVSPLSRSIRGLSTVGVALALTERGWRQDRFRVAGRRRPRREERRELRPSLRLRNKPLPE
jgi:hypothetical protein